MKEKVLFAVKNMNVGGVEKSLLSLLNTIDPEQYEVDLLLLENYGGFMSQIPEWVNVIICKEYEKIKDDVNFPPIMAIKRQIQRGNWNRAIRLLIGYALAKCSGHYRHYYKVVFCNVPKYNKHYDVAIAYTSLIGYLTWLVNFHVCAEKRIGWIHFDIRKLSVNHEFISFLHRNMEKIYVVSKEAFDAFTKEFSEIKDQCELRYNVVDRKNILKLAEEPVECIREPGVKTIVTLGRLSTEKGQDIIPEVAARLKASGLKFKWYLIGEGGLRKVIEEKTLQYNVNDNVILLGQKTNPYPYLKQADLYVQASIHEGYCITLAEARAFGMPIVSTDFAGAHEQLDGRMFCFVVRRSVPDIYAHIKKGLELF